MKDFSQYFKKEDFLLILLFILLCFLVLWHSYFNGYYISVDSTDYLRAVQSFLDGNGFFINKSAGDSQRYFSQWPIGYPFFIAIISKITLTEVYLASKILSIVILGFIFTLLRNFFREKAWLFALPLFIPENLLIFYHTWSEQMFIFGIILFTLIISNIIKSENVNMKDAFFLTFSALIMFMSRYIGVFSLVVISFVILFLLIKGVKANDKLKINSSVKLISSVLFLIFVVVFYFYMNYKHTGYFTGEYQRYVAESKLNLNDYLLGFKEMMKMQIRITKSTFSVLRLSSIFVIISYLILFVLLLRFLILNHNNKGKISIVLSSLLVSFSYYLVYIVFHFSTTAGGDNRFFVPSFLVLLIGVIFMFLHYDFGVKITKVLKKYRLISYSLLVIIFLTPTFKVNIKAKNNSTSYNTIYNYVEEATAQIPSQSVVFALYGSSESFVNYIRPDLIFYFISYQENVQNIQNKMLSNRNSYFFISENDLEKIKNVSNIDLFRFINECNETIQNIYFLQN